MERYGTLVRSWYAVTPSGYPVLVEEHQHDLSYIVEFYDGDELSGKQIISHCPISGELLTLQMLRQATVEIAVGIV